MNYNIRQRIINLIMEVLVENNLVIAISEDTKLLDDLGFDSSTIMNLIVALEEEFDFEFSEDDNLIEIMNTLYTLQKYIESVI